MVNIQHKKTIYVFDIVDIINTIKTSYPEVGDISSFLLYGAEHMLLENGIVVINTKVNHLDKITNTLYSKIIKECKDRLWGIIFNFNYIFSSIVTDKDNCEVRLNDSLQLEIVVIHSHDLISGK